MTQSPRSATPQSAPRVLVTGGAGYIGSHTLLHLISAGYDVCVIDNFCNSSPEVLRRVKALSGKDVALKEIDIRDAPGLSDACAAYRPDAVILFAGLKAVGDSVAEPLLYYANYVTGTLNLLSAMDAAGCNRIVFSSSATVYGDAQRLPIDEAHPVNPVNVYGHTKAMVETILEGWCAVNPARSAAILRYFNPVGAHPSGQIGEDPDGTPNNLMPYVARVAAGTLPEIGVFGDDFATHDGTGEQNYIHVEDLASDHVAALRYLWDHNGSETFNLGTGHGSTVMEVLNAYEDACGKPIPRRITPRRTGDTDSSVADPSKANSMLGWRAEATLLDACKSSWKWQSANPAGFAKGDQA